MCRSTERLSDWLPTYREAPYLRMRLFCFPHAGGTAALFRKWQQLFPPEIQVCPVQLPGHGRRISEPPCKSLIQLARLTTAALIPALTLPFFLLGHSMGALLAFEITRCLRELQGPLPAWLCLSARRAPHLAMSDVAAYRMPDVMFVSYLQSLGGITEAIAKSDDLLSLVLPTVRADLEAVATYRYIEQPPLQSSILAIGGREDPTVGPAELDAWNVHTACSFKRELYPGGHFFVYGEHSAIGRTVRNLATMSI